jgi:hypothetical protein
MLLLRFERLFKERGLPANIRSDNGAGRKLGQLSASKTQPAKAA